MLKLSQAVIVEGRYDRIRLASVLDALIVETSGFRIFSDAERQRFIRRLAEERGILILTDSDAAGFKIRAFLGGMVPQDRIYHAYIPDIFGKEKRKERRSSEGKLGVEAMDAEVLRQAILRSGVSIEESDTPSAGAEPPVSMAELYALGLTGTENSAQKRRAVFAFLELPAHLSTSAFLRVVNGMLGRETLLRAVRRAEQSAHL